MQPWRREARQLWKLALPVTTVQLGMMAMSVVDAMMVGRVSEVDLAAVNVGHSYSFVFIAVGMGLLMALDPIVSQAWGARDHEAIARGIQRGLLLAALVSVPICLAILPAAPALAVLRQVEDVVPVASAYARAIVPGIPFFLVFVVLRHTLQSMHVLWPITATIVVANLANVALNRVLIFGAFGIEPMGAEGSAWATSSVRALMVTALLIWSWPRLAPYLRPLRPEIFRLGPLWSVLRLGAPIGLQVGAEVGAFCVMSLMVGSLGATEASGSIIALNLAALAFMVPLGISAAASVRVGNAIGRGDPEGTRRSTGVALVFGTGFMVLTAACFVLFPEPLARLYTGEAAVVAVAVTLIRLAALFQVFDGLQVVTTGVLRGAADTRVPMLVHLCGFWIVGMPLAWWLGIGRSGGDPAGVWWGLTVGLIAVSLVLCLRVRSRLRAGVARLDLEGGSSVAAEPPAPVDALAAHDSGAD